jgi:hypothetical protein
MLSTLFWWKHKGDWSCKHEERTGPRASRENAKGLRFLRDIKFPRFSMAAGEIWQGNFDPACALSGTARKYYAAIDSGDARFEFAGGVCLVKDVELVFLSAEQVQLRSSAARNRKMMHANRDAGREGHPSWMSGT